MKYIHVRQHINSKIKKKNIIEVRIKEENVGHGKDLLLFLILIALIVM